MFNFYETFQLFHKNMCVMTFKTDPKIHDGPCVWCVCDGPSPSVFHDDDAGSYDTYDDLLL